MRNDNDGANQTVTRKQTRSAGAFRARPQTPKAGIQESTPWCRAARAANNARSDMAKEGTSALPALAVAKPREAPIPRKGGRWRRPSTTGVRKSTLQQPQQQINLRVSEMATADVGHWKPPGAIAESRASDHPALRVGSRRHPWQRFDPSVRI